MKTKDKKQSKTINTDCSVNTLHAMHCGGACMLKLHMKDGVISKITSAGDIPREGSLNKDEGVSTIQRRACLLGLSEKNRIYAPDRLKHPLIQTGERGDLRGFKQISWEQALDTAAAWYSEMIDRQKQLGYLPILDEGGVSRFIGPYLSRFGNTSSGNTQAATFAAIGEYSRLKGNPVMDMYNARYIVLWANDTQANYPSFSFILMKAKEAGIPITVVDTRNTDTAAAMATGSDDVPRHICVRPGTDGALLAAMCFVIYQNELHDEKFLKEYCFGFYKNDRVTSKSNKLNPVTNEPYQGREFTVPKGQSFEEYLEELGQQHGGYEGVLAWAQNLTGTPANLIEKFALHYARTTPTFLFTKFTGPQRTSSGMYFTWMLIALSAMTGNINKRGGGFGEVRFDDGYTIELDEPQKEIFDKEYEPVLISMSKIADVLLRGSDGRTKEQLRGDVLAMNGIDLGEDAKITLEMYVRGKGLGNILNSQANVNKNLKAWKNFKHILAHERFMTTTASYADLVLPTATDFEQRYFADQLMSEKFVVNGPISELYEAKSDDWINEQIAKRLGIGYRLSDESDMEIMRRQWKSAKVPEGYSDINPSFKLPSFEEMIENGSVELPVPLDKTVIYTDSIAPGEYDTETGRINFYSPYMAERKRATEGVFRAQYVELDGGYEHVFRQGGQVGLKGIPYTLQLITPHEKHRALTTFANIPAIDEQCPHAVNMHPADAEKRGMEDGDTVYVYTDVGCIRLPVKLTRRVPPGVVSIAQGAWYRPSAEETYEAWIELGEGVKKYIVPVDIGGCVNTLTRDRNSGALDPFYVSLGHNANGALCEVSKIKPQ